MVSTRNSDGKELKQTKLEDVSDIQVGDKRKADEAVEPEQNGAQTQGQEHEDKKVKTGEESGERNGEKKGGEVEEENAMELDEKEDGGEAKKDEKEATSTSEKKEGEETNGNKKYANGSAVGPDAGGSNQNGSIKNTTDKNTIETSQSQADATPSTTLEKGIIYFVTRGRVDTSDPHSTQDLQRTFIVLRPLPAGASLNDGALPDDASEVRVLAVPKKVLPKSASDRFMIFVDAAGQKLSELKESFFASSSYNLQSGEERTTPATTPVGEGVYAITLVGRNSHLAYSVAIPQELGDVQRDLGIKSRGSFVLSFKNPEAGGPASAQLDEKPDLSKETMDKFRGRRWMPVDDAGVLGVQHAQFLLIGEGQDEFKGAMEAAEKDKNDDDKKTPEEDFEKLEEEEEERVEHLKGDDTIFDDLHLDKKHFPDLKSTW